MNKKGFSLVEVMVTTAIFTFICAGIYAVLICGSQVWSRVEPKVVMQQDARNSLIRMSADIREAESMSTPIPGDVTSSCLIRDLSGNDITFSLNEDGELIRSSGGNEIILARNLSAVSFAREAADPAVVKLTATAEVSGVESTLVLNTRVQGRNL